MKPITPALIPVFEQLTAEGFEVYSYETDWYKDIRSFFWFEHGRILDIQPFWAGGFHFGVEYIPSTANGSGCSLLPSDCYGAVDADQILRYRNMPTWVSGVRNYKSMEEYIKRAGLRFFRVRKE